MPKINLHSLPMQDASFFDNYYELVNIVIHNDINDLFCCDKFNYPLFNLYTAKNHVNEIKTYLDTNLNNKVILLDFYENECNSTSQLKQLNLYNYVELNQLLIISSSDWDQGTWVNIDYFLKVTGGNYNQIVSLNEFEKIYNNTEKPFDFLFLNKKSNPYRVALLDNCSKLNLLNCALWSDLSRNKQLPVEYKDFYNGQLDEIKINNTNFSLNFVEGVLNPKLYIDSYFSVVTETNFTSLKSFRTEKIYKPLLIGHPFIAVANYHYYKDLKNIGFKTFNGLIDETFDDILNDTERLQAITNSIDNLCKSDLKNFLKEAKPICEYNRLHYFELLGKDPLKIYNLINDFFDKI
jgi:hypothetical protein